MGEHFLQWINIVDFKCFHNFEAKDFKRVNLISGKNNVGKTAFMEACYINTYTTNIATFADSLSQIKFAREKINIFLQVFHYANKINLHDFLESINFYHCQSNLKLTEFDFQNDDGIKHYIFSIDSQTKHVNPIEFTIDHFETNVKYIDTFGISDKKLASNYAFIQEQDKEPLLNDLIQKFDPSIEFFKVIGDKPQCKFQGDYIDLTEFGDGLKHYISIICALYSCENGQLFIDEIDNGIHYTQLDNMWELILNISIEVNCQVFTTTHSKECIESYARVSKKLKDKKITFIELGKNKNNEIKSITMDYDRLQNELENTNEVRGW